MPVTKRLTTKQRKFVKAKAQGKTGVAAAKEAYGVTDYNVANNIAVTNLQKPTIQAALEAEFEKQGITMEAIVKPIKDGLTASKVIVMGKESQDSFVDLTPDHAVRLKASSMAAQFMGIGKQATVEGGIHFHQHVEEKKGDYEF